MSSKHHSGPEKGYYMWQHQAGSQEFKGTQTGPNLAAVFGNLGRDGRTIEWLITTDVPGGRTVRCTGTLAEGGAAIIGGEFFNGNTNEKLGEFTGKKEEPPKCGLGHDMIISSYAGGAYQGGYVCDHCRGSSANGLCGGGMERWFCRQCHDELDLDYDLCFNCVPKPRIEKVRVSG